MDQKENEQIGLSTLGRLLEPKKAENLWFEGKDITLDGYKFVECRFDNCKLHVSNAENVDLERCFISDDTVIIFNGGAIAAIRLFHCKNDYFYQNHPHWVPQRDARGRITLKNHRFDSLASYLGQNNV